MLESNDTAAHTDSNTPDMGKVYNEFAEAFGEADRLPTWRYLGKPAMERLLQTHLRPGITFLDFGSASGRVEAGVLLPAGVRPEDITGIEISPDQVEMAKVRIPGATFIAGDIADECLVESLGSFDVVFSHMVFEHLSDVQFAQVCVNAYGCLQPGGVYSFVVTHPDKMTDLQGNLLEHYGAFTTTAPWGGVLHNWRRSVEQTLNAVREAGLRSSSSRNSRSRPSRLPTWMPKVCQNLQKLLKSTAGTRPSGWRSRQPSGTPKE